VLKVGDIILAVDRQPIRKHGDVEAALRAHEGPDPITITIVRDGKFPEVLSLSPTS